MDFHFNKVIKSRTPPQVALQLEACLEEQAWRVWIVGDRFFAYGIGPSAHSINPHDQTTLEVKEVNGGTIVLIEVSYQGLDTSSVEDQNHIVWSKIEAVFESLRLKLHLEPQMIVTQFAGEPIGHVTSSPVEIKSEAIQSSGEGQAVFIEETPFKKPASQQEKTKVSTPPPLVADRSTLTDHQPISSSSGTADQHPEPVAAKVRSLPFVDLSTLADTSRSRLVTLFAGLQAKVVLGALATLFILLSATWLFRHRTTSDQSKVASTQKSSASTTPQSAATEPPHPEANLQKDTQRAPITRRPVKVDEASIKSLLEDWAAAQRSRDAKMQSSFYAERVAPYPNRSAVTLLQVYEDKQNSIHNRIGLWTFKIEDVSVHRQTDETVSVRLRKHFMTQTGSVEVTERVVLCILTLRQIDGTWKIAGERDIS